MRRLALVFAVLLATPRSRSSLPAPEKHLTRPARTRSSSTTPSDSSMAPTSRSPESAPARSHRSSSTRIRCSRSSPSTLRRAGSARFAPTRSASRDPVADRRVLHRLPARSARPGAGAREHDPGHAHAVDDRGRPVAERAAAPLPAATGADHQRARRRRGGSLRRHRDGAAARRAAITQTDNLLHLLANDSKTLQRLTVSADTV